VWHEGAVAVHRPDEQKARNLAARSPSTAVRVAASKVGRQCHELGQALDVTTSDAADQPQPC
jgi:hypothetical protein